MMKPIMTFDIGDIVRVPFPFTDRTSHKRRPAIVLSTKPFNDSHMHLILAMITSAKNSSWPSDIVITDLASTGLQNASVIRFKIFTLDERLVLGKLGKISKKDGHALKKQMANVFS